MSENNEVRKIIVEDTSGDRYECEISANTTLESLAADFFEDHDWPTTDSRGRGQRAVLELVDPENPDRTKRLRGEETVEKAGLWDGAIIRIFPESIAGMEDQRKRISALIADHKDMIELTDWNPYISFEANTRHAPTLYKLTFNYRSFKGISSEGLKPLYLDKHQVEITMIPEYPQRAPRVRWITPIFHPNISPETGGVCLGVLMDRYLPGLGLARIVTMLAEMIQYRNYDTTNPMNKEAAKWVSDPDNHKYIDDEKIGIGGSTCQGPVNDIIKELERLWNGEGKRPRIVFKSLND